MEVKIKVYVSFSIMYFKYLEEKTKSFHIFLIKKYLFDPILCIARTRQKPLGHQ